MASYVAAYRIGMLVSTAGALFLVSGFESAGFGQHAAWTSPATSAMAALVLVGIATTLFATEPEQSAQAGRPCAGRSSLDARGRSRGRRLPRFLVARSGACRVLAFVVLFKFTDALAGAMTAPFVIDLGFSRNAYAAIIKGVGLAALLIGGFAGGFVARACPLADQPVDRRPLAGCRQPRVLLAGRRRSPPTWLTFAIIVENFTSAIGTVIFVAYLSALCRNPLHTATQYALLTALAAFGRTYLSSGAALLPNRLGVVLCDLRARRPADAAHLGQALGEGLGVDLVGVEPAQLVGQALGELRGGAGVIRRTGWPGWARVATTPSGRTRSMSPLRRSSRTLTMPVPARRPGPGRPGSAASGPARRPAGRSRGSRCRR